MKNARFSLLLAAALLLAACGGETAQSVEPEATLAEKVELSEKENDAGEESGRSENDAGEESGRSANDAGEDSSRVEVDTAQEVASASGEIFAMDTYMTVTCYGDRCEEALEASLAEIDRLDRLLSVGKEASEISLLNAQGSGNISEDTAAMVKAALEIYDTTGGAFDITVYPLMELWGFTTGNFAVPDEARLAELLALVGSDRIEYDESSLRLTLAEGQGIDLGGIAKGFASGRLMQIFEEYDLVSGMVWLGGNVQCYGTKTDGSLWRCGIQDPRDPDNSNRFLGIVSVADKAVITSGAYERYFEDEETGEIYHHILDPKTGYPSDSGLASVTIVSSDGTLADALSTACYVMGLEEATNYWREYGDDFDMILMTEDGIVYVTEPLAENFTSDFTACVIKKES